MNQERKDIRLIDVVNLLARLGVVENREATNYVFKLISERLKTMSKKVDLIIKDTTDTNHDLCNHNLAKDTKAKAQKNLRFLKKRHEQTGFDSDYLGDLNTEESVFMERFAREYYDGESSNTVWKKESNHRRYMAKQADAMSKAKCSSDTPLEDLQVDDLDPETLLLLREELAKK